MATRGEREGENARRRGRLRRKEREREREPGKVSRIDEEGRYLLQRATFVSSAPAKHENSRCDGAIGANNNGRA